jgi:hypothetical protein
MNKYKITYIGGETEIIEALSAEYADGRATLRLDDGSWCYVLGVESVEKV